MYEAINLLIRQSVLVRDVACRYHACPPELHQLAEFWSRSVVLLACLNVSRQIIPFSRLSRYIFVPAMLININFQLLILPHLTSSEMSRNQSYLSTIDEQT
jgi:hypothetical protein